MDRLLRSQIWQRADSQCEYCQMSQEFTEAGHEVDHIIAEKHHGLTTLENLGLACFPCNNHKGPNIAGIDPKTGQVTRLFHPRIDDWSAHFAWRGATLMGYAVSDFLYTDASIPGVGDHIACRSAID